jgi:hypothetical protein
VAAGGGDHPGAHAGRGDGVFLRHDDG